MFPKIKGKEAIKNRPAEELLLFRFSVAGEGTSIERCTLFPLPILGVLLVIEGLRIMLLVRDTVDVKGELPIAMLVGLIAAGLPYGYLVGICVGTILYYLGRDRAFTHQV